MTAHDPNHPPHANSPDGDAPLTVGDAHSAVRGLHVTPELKRRAARELAKQVDDVLAEHFLRGVALSVKKA